MKKLIAGLIVCAALFGCSQNSKKEGTPVTAPKVSTAAVKDNSSPVAAAPETNLKAVKGDELLPEVAKAFKGIVVSVKQIKNGTSTEVALPFGKEVKIAGTNLVVKIVSYFPNFIMVDGGVANKSMDEVNPGAKVLITKAGKVVFNGWLFQKFPEAHGFNDPDYKVVMVKSTPAGK